MQVSKLLLVVAALVCVVLGAETSAAAAVVPEARPVTVRASEVRPTGPAAALGGTFVEGGCCYPLMIKCCYTPPTDAAAFPPALGDAGGDSP
jgi:hypothetical protein